LPLVRKTRRALWGRLAAATLASAVLLLTFGPNTAVRRTLGPAADVSTITSGDAFVADFDGNRRPDEVRLSAEGYVKVIDVILDGISKRQLRFRTGSPLPGFLSAVDVNNDRKLDLIWRPSSEAEADVVWLGDGEGNFLRLRAGYPPPHAAVAWPAGGMAGRSGTGGTRSANSTGDLSRRQNRLRRGERRWPRFLGSADRRPSAPPEASTKPLAAVRQLAWSAQILNLPPPRSAASIANSAA
jgi:hypothetical protein